MADKKFEKHMMYKGKKAVKANTYEKHLELKKDGYDHTALKMKTSPALLKLSSSCKAAARKKFDVYPSAYANMWASKTQKKGKC
tara:strand:+ start:590 stop:841 length:252 start_codon:yes stop_codon:yes gene_type:complete